MATIQFSRTLCIVIAIRIRTLCTREELPHHTYENLQLSPRNREDQVGINDLALYLEVSDSKLAMMDDT